MRMTQEALNREALRLAHPFQKQRLESLLAKGWKVMWIKTLDGVSMMGVYNEDGTNTLSAMLWPNGLMQSAAKGDTRLRWSWKKARELSEATIPGFQVAA